MSKHWTEVQRWQNTTTGEIKTAAELLKQFDRYLRINRVSLCCSEFDIRMNDDSIWRRIEAED